MEARAFWERVYLAAIERASDAKHNGEIADAALLQWRSRFEPKAGE